MDPLSQGVLGATFSQAFSKKHHIIAASAMGFLAGLTPDLDVFIASPEDPLLFLKYHRQFTHSLIFIPIGGFICACVFYWLFAKRLGMSFKQSYVYSTLGYATHGLLDTCTSYGTQLLWPFTDARFAWNTISIIDPIFTVPIVLMILIALFRRSLSWARACIIWVVFYQGLGWYQNQRVADYAWQLAEQRGHEPIRLVARPSFANILLWKAMYEVDTGFYTDGVRAGKELRLYEGEYIAKLNVQRDFPWLDKDSQQAKDLERFTWFSDGYVSIDPHNSSRVIDARYSLLPNEIQGLWGIVLSPNAAKNEHVKYSSVRNVTDKDYEIFFSMLRND